MTLIKAYTMTRTQYDHCGLYFTQQHILTARKGAKRAPFQPAWERLDAPVSSQAAPLEQALIHGLRWRFHENEAEGETAVRLYQTAAQSPLDDHSLLDGCMYTVGLAQLYELVRDHPHAAQITHADGPALFMQRALQVEAALDSDDPQGMAYLERIWAALLLMAAGVVTENDDFCQRAASVYHQIIDHDIHPAGFIPQVVDGKDGGSLLRMLIALKGLVLIAEAAPRSGLDLWTYSNRGVSLTTAALYPLYYYYYPEKWQWDADLDPDAVKADFSAHAGYLEPLNRHIGRPTQAIDLILSEIRPIFDPYGGGLLTLSHAVPQRRGLFG